MKLTEQFLLKAYPFALIFRVITVIFTLKAPITSAADNIHKYFFIVFSEKTRLDVSSESSARQRIHMKNEALCSSKDNSKKLKCCLLQFLFGTLRVKVIAQIKETDIDQNS